MITIALIIKLKLGLLLPKSEKKDLLTNINIIKLCQMDIQAENAVKLIF